MKRTEWITVIVGIGSLIVAIFACIATYLALPQIQRLFEKTPTSPQTIIVQVTVPLPIPLPTYTPQLTSPPVIILAPTSVPVVATPIPPPSEILPPGVSSVNEMPTWLAANVGGTPNQWKRLQSGRWQFRAGNAGGVGENQILSPKVGYLIFGADSGRKDNSSGVVWADVSIGPAESTFWQCSLPNKPGSIDSADWLFYNPNVGKSCK